MVTTSMNVALVGLPQSGKKTLFTLLTGRHLPPGRRENEAIEGLAPVRDLRVSTIAGICNPERTKYAEVTYVLCPDVRTAAHREWTDAARKCDLVCVLVRAFRDAEVYHPAGSVDAARDRREIEAELLLADLEVVEKRLERMGKEKRAGQTPQQVVEEHALAKCKTALEDGRTVQSLELAEQEKQAILNLGLLTLKPVLWAHNVGEGDVTEGQDPFTVACKIEQEIMDLESPDERNAYLKELGLSSSGVDRMNQAAYGALGLMSFYTMGPDEVRAWTIRKGTPAPVAAGKIHSDIERGFIRVEIIKYDDLLACGSEAAVRSAGKVMIKGKDYVIEDGDICHFRFSV
jgi:ribosome-binding ATPase